MSTSGLARYLIKEGLLSESDCQLIARDHGNTGAAFAKVVVSLGILSEEKLAKFLADKTRLPMLPHRQFCSVKPGAESALPVPLMKSLEVVPVELSHGQLTVAMADPLDQDTLHQLRFFTSLRIRPMIATFTSLYKSLENLVQGFSPQKTTLQKLLLLHTPEPVPTSQLPRADYKKPLPPVVDSKGDEEDDGFWDSPTAKGNVEEEPLPPIGETDSEGDLDNFDEFEDGSLDEFQDSDQSAFVEDEDFPLDTKDSRSAFAGVDVDDLMAADPLPDFDPALLPADLQEKTPDASDPGTESWDDIMGGTLEEPSGSKDAARIPEEVEAGGGLFFDEAETKPVVDENTTLDAGGGLIFDEQMPEETAEADVSGGESLLFDEEQSTADISGEAEEINIGEGDALFFGEEEGQSAQSEPPDSEEVSEEGLFFDEEVSEEETATGDAAQKDHTDDDLLFGAVVSAPPGESGEDLPGVEENDDELENFFSEESTGPSEKSADRGEVGGDFHQALGAEDSEASRIEEEGGQVALAVETMVEPEEIREAEAEAEAFESDDSLETLGEELEELEDQSLALDSPDESDQETLAEIEDLPAENAVPEIKKHTKKQELGAGFLNHALAGVSLSMKPEKAREAMSQGMVKAGIKKGAMYRVKDEKVIYVTQWNSDGPEQESLKNPKLSGLPPSTEPEIWLPLTDVPEALNCLQENTHKVMVHWGPDEKKGRGLTIAGWDQEASDSKGLQNLAASLSDRFIKKVS